MNYLQLKTQFLGLLNRRDITPSLTETFMGMAIQRIQRELRVSGMEAQAVVNPPDPILVPADLLELISLEYSPDNETGWTRLVRVSGQRADDLFNSGVVGTPIGFTRDLNVYNIGPASPDGSFIYIHYYAAFPALAADTDTNWLTLNAPDLLIYSALGYAGDFYLDERAKLFEQRYTGIVERLNEQTIRDDLVTGVIDTPWIC